MCSINLFSADSVVLCLYVPFGSHKWGFSDSDQTQTWLVVHCTARLHPLGAHQRTRKDAQVAQKGELEVS